MVTALLAADTPTSPCVDEMVEVRYWEAEDVGSLLAIKTNYPEDPAMSMQIDGRVAQLVTWEADDSDRLMRDLQEEMKRGNRRIAQMLAAAFYQRRFDVDARGLALETLAAARLRWFEDQVVELVRSALDAPEPELQFAGIAAASDLSRANQVAMSRVIRTVAGSHETGASVKQAAEAFLRHVNRSNLVRS